MKKCVNVLRGPLSLGIEYLMSKYFRSWQKNSSFSSALDFFSLSPSFNERMKYELACECGWEREPAKTCENVRAATHIYIFLASLSYTRLRFFDEK
jgi:hypothetical protein